MSLLHEIQAAVLNPVTELGSVLLKLRLLASKLDSQNLAEWVRHESEGYPDGSLLPDYRIFPVNYSATFSGPLGSGINNAPIPMVLVEQFAGEHWTKYEMRQSVAAVDQLLANIEKGNGTLTIDASHLILMLQGKVYPQYSCIEAHGKIPASALAALKHAVQNRILELTIQLEKSIPEAAAVSIGQSGVTSPASSGAATQIAQQIIYGNMTSISAADGARVNIGIHAGSVDEVVRYLSSRGIPAEDANEFAEIVAAEKPDSADEPLGKKARTWLIESLKKTASGTWKVGVTVATDVIKEAALKYYGFK